MPQRMTIPDEEARAFAEATFDRNVVVLAGAGTGKTTLLVKRLVNALMREPQPLAITELLALTFTNKAATEMKVRLRERLHALVLAARDGPAGGELGQAALLELRDRYRLSAAGVAERAQRALHDVEKAQIGTLHSFAAHLLRLYPIESGVDPAFREDDGDRFDEHFRHHWDWWIHGQLALEGGEHARWRRVFRLVSLAQLRDFGRALCSELVSVEELRAQLAQGDGSGEAQRAVREWIEAQRARGTALLASHAGPKRRKLETMLARAVALFEHVCAQGLDSVPALDSTVRDELAWEIPARPKGWTPMEHAEARALIGVARQMFEVDHDLLRDVVDLLAPLVGRVRATFLAQGWISFDGLLARARRLLREHPRVRERLKHAYKSILIDEFQDTDPVQYEIVLYLAERPGHCGLSWSGIDLEPGKLFIVGDPKQSIYAFRRADIEAFHRVVTKIQETGGAVRDLVTNFRSSPAVLQVVNRVFDALFRPEAHVQPGNVHLQPCPERPERLRVAGVERRLVVGRPEGEDFDAAAATRAEAEALAAWLQQELREGEALVDEQGRRGPLRPGHVALLFRKLTQAQHYLEALRRHDIPYVTEGEKHFYRRQEVIDLLNVLRAVENPCDRIAMVGVLRSPLGGVSDREIYELAERGALDCRLPERLNGWASSTAGVVRHLYAQLLRLSQTVHRLPLPEAVARVFEVLPVLELAAGSLHGEQAVANLHKVRHIAAQVADRPHLTLTGFVELMARRITEEPDEGEGALGEASLDAVQILTIHKAKGLEFPVVVLPGLHQGGGRAFVRRPLTVDWSTGLLGVSLANRCNGGALLVGQKSRIREMAERRRVLYVGMTRAKERLVLFGGLPATRAPESFLDLLEEAGCPIDPEADGDPAKPMLQTVMIQAPDRKGGHDTSPRRGLNADVNWTALMERWEARHRCYQEILATPGTLTPTQLGETVDAGNVARGPGAIEQEKAQVIGTLTHRVLEAWDFIGAQGRLRRQVEVVCRHALPPEWEGRRAEIVQDIEEMLRLFMASPPYDELSHGTILAREIPFVMPWTGSSPHSSRLRQGFGGQVGGQALLISHCPTMSGAIDVLYRAGDRLWVADYKTDRVPLEAVEQRAQAYRPQALVYRAAAARALGLEKVGCKLIFLRHGRAVEVE